jgi:cyclopropane-fatty-acyl-phospholipid synthase
MELDLPCLIVGGGVAGLGSAWALHTAGRRVCVLEADASHLGGHAHTITVSIPSFGDLPVDIGFIVYNEQAYPNLVSWFNELNIETEPSDMSFSVSVPLEAAANTRLEWSSDSLWTLFGDRRNLMRLRFHRMLRDILRFHKEAVAVLRAPATEQTLGEFLSTGQYSDAFRDWYLAPMVAAVWSTSPDDALLFPAHSIFAFFHNHGFLQLFRRPQWRTVRGRSRVYTERVRKALTMPSPANGITSEIRLGARVTQVLERPDNGPVTLQLADGQAVRGSCVVFATHADETLRILGGKATAEERAFLSAFQYVENEVVIHRDERFMPQRQALWSSWNFVPQPFRSAASDEGLGNKVQVTYFLNRLQNLPKEIPPLFETLNPAMPPREELVLARFRLAHPMLTSRAVQAQAQLADILSRREEKRDVYFAGAYCGYGFHEDALVSGLEAAQQISGMFVPWRSALMPASSSIAGSLVGDRKSARPPAPFSLRGAAGRAVHQRVLRYLQQAIRYGSLVMVMPDGTEYIFGTLNSHESNDPHVGRLLEAYGLSEQPVRLHIRRHEFFWRVVTGADIGFAEAYMDGDCDVGGCTTRHGIVSNHTGVELVRLFKLFILNRDMGSLAAEELGPLARLGMQMNTLVHLIWRRNTPGGSRSNIEAHYDLSNDLFATFLGNRWVYSCALWDRPEMDLDEAQQNKLQRVIDKLRLDEAESVLEIGCGWGALAIEIAKQFPRIEVLGITLSTEQLQHAQAWAARAGVADRVTFRLEDYRTLYQTLEQETKGVDANVSRHATVNGRSRLSLPRRYHSNSPSFDRVVSIEMLEAVGHEFLGIFFASCDKLLSRSGLLVVQVITTPEARYETYRKSSDFINKHIFPGSCCPSFHALVHACTTAAPSLSVIDVESIGVHYAPTLASWQQRFLENLQRVRQLGFSDSFIRKFVYYLSYCEAGFATRTLDDLQVVFSRPGNVLSLGGEPSVATVDGYRRHGAQDFATR